MPPAKKATSASKRSKVMGGAEDEVITDQAVEGADDAAVSSRAKDKLFGDAPKDENGVRPAEPTQGVTAVAPDNAQVEVSPDPTPERHDHSEYEKDFVDATEDDADFDAEEKAADA